MVKSFLGGSFFIITFKRPLYSLKGPELGTQKKAQKSTQKIVEIIAHNKFMTRVAPSIRA